MSESTPSLFAAWESFYVIVGSSAGALTGLQFVVVTLIAQAPGRGTTPEIAAFGTPTVVHFCAVLLGSAILSAPWVRLSSAAVALGFCAGAGMLYVALVLRRARRQTGYRPVLEDWIWHTILPFAAYAALLAAAIELPRSPGPALFAVGGTALALLFTGIHNAWDAVTYLAVEWLPRQDRSKDLK